MRERELVLLSVCFFLSGLAALVYETAWTQQLSFVFGTSELAVATVLAAYMAGLGTGAAVIGRFSPVVRRPVLVYALLELGIAVTALAVPLGLRGANALYGALFGGGAGPPGEGGLATALFFLVAAFGILVVPTAFMGATLPLLARHAVQSDSHLGPRIGRLYAVNTFGAVSGTLLAAFFLLPALGLERTILVAVAVNVAVFAVAAALARSGGGTAPLQTEGLSSRSLRRFVLPFIALSGVVSFAYEVLWTRLLSHVLGGSVYSFATMLASFLLGIAFGSAAAARFATSFRTAARGFAVAQIGIALLSWTAYMAVDALPALSRGLRASGLSGLMVDVLVCVLVLLPPALCIGATFPFAVRVAARDERSASLATAHVYAWNTAGAIVGAIGAAFVLLPGLGIAGSVRFMLLASLALALAMALAVRAGAVLVGVAGVALLATALVPLSQPWMLLRTGVLGRVPVEGPIDFFAVGRSATVLVIRGQGGWYVRSNGLPEAFVLQHGGRVGGRGAAQRWEGLLPALVRPDLDELLVVGLGGGVAVEAVPRTIRAIEVVELEHEILEANRRIAAGRMIDPLADPRVHVTVNDARAALRLMDGKVDAVASQPSHPWTAGASHLYTREFFGLVKDRLASDGVLVQWLGIHFLDEALLRSMLATLQETFPHVQLWFPNASTAALFVASNEPFSVEETVPRALAADPQLFDRFGLATFEDVFVALAMDAATTRRFGSGGTPIRDGRNVLAMRAPRIGEKGLRYYDVWELVGGSDPVLEHAASLRVGPTLRALLSRGDRERAERYLARLEDPADRALGSALLAIDRNKLSDATWHLRNALRLAPDAIEARAAWLLLSRRGLLEDSASPPFGPWTRAEQAIVTGWRSLAFENGSSLQANEATLAEIGAGHPLRLEALRQRARWRIDSEEPRLARQALALLDVVLAHGGEADDPILRARAARIVSDWAVVVASLEGWSPGAAGRLDRGAGRAALGQALALLEAVPAESEHAIARDRIVERLSGRSR